MWFRTLAEYFQDMDVVPSDFAAGLVLLRKYQKYQEHVALLRAIEEQQVPDSQVSTMLARNCYFSVCNNLLNHDFLKRKPKIVIVDTTDNQICVFYFLQFGTMLYQLIMIL